MDTLTFNTKSKDLIDCPFIPIDGYLVSLPTIVSNASPSEAYLSNFSNLNLDISFKGNGFVKRFLRKLTNLGIPNSNIYVKENQDEYECDVVFAIEGDLYFVECKSFLQPQTPRAHYEFVDKMLDASIQLNRINDFYIAHFDNVRKELNLSERWTPNSVHKLILCSAMIGEVNLLNDCFLIDNSILMRFLNRESPGIAWGKIRVQSPDENYTGEITAEKLIM